MVKGQPAQWRPLDRHMDIQARLMRVVEEHREISRLLEEEARAATLAARKERPR